MRLFCRILYKPQNRFKLLLFIFINCLKEIEKEEIWNKLFQCSQLSLLNERKNYYSLLFVSFDAITPSLWINLNITLKTYLKALSLESLMVWCVIITTTIGFLMMVWMTSISAYELLSNEVLYWSLTRKIFNVFAVI